MSKVHIGRQGFLTKNALPNITRPGSGVGPSLSGLLNANQTTDNISNTNVVDSSTFNTPISYQSGMVSQVQISPFGPGIGGSFRFDSWGDWLQVSGTNNQFAFGTGDFTVEFWVFAPVADQFVLFDLRTSANSGGANIWCRGSPLVFAYNSGGVDRLVGNTVFVSNTWYHIAAVRISGTLRLYVNGVQQTNTWADSTNYGAPVNGPVFGQAFATSPSFFSNYAGNSTLRGFMSNIRIVRGVGVYTGNFTVPTSPLTATQSAGTNIAAITGTQTSLLLSGTNYMVVDSSTNNTKGLAAFSLNYGMTGGQVNFHPYSGSGKYGSYWIDGSFSYIDSPSNSDFQMTGDFTMEAWIYPTQAKTSVIASNWFSGNSTSNSFVFFVNSSNRLIFLGGQGTSNITTTATTTTIIQNAWNHVAVTRVGTTIRLWVNGVQDATTGTISGSLNSTTYPLRIGSGTLSTSVTNAVPGLSPSPPTWPGDLILGYITGFRIVKGTAVYTGTFAPPSIQPVDVDGASSAASYPSTTNVNTSFASTQTSLLCRFDRWTLQDNDVLPRPVYLLGTAQTSTTQAKFGAASLSSGTTLNNTTLTYLASPYNLGTGNFTIQCWAYTSAWNAPNSQNPLWTIGLPNSGTNSSNVYSLYISNTGSVVLNRYGTGDTTIGTINTANYTNVWFHVALIRLSGTINVYIDGISIGSTSAFSGLTFGNQTGILAGGRYNIGLTGVGTYTMWNGFIDDFVVAPSALYASNFTPPDTQATDPYPALTTNNTYGVIQKYN